jgi:hypothetical protein
LLLGAWLAWTGARRAAAPWCSLFGLAVGITVVTKVAFIGWGVGVPGPNFTGVSGHAMHAAAVIPMLLCCAAANGSGSAHAVAMATGLLVAAGVAVSRHARRAFGQRGSRGVRSRRHGGAADPGAWRYPCHERPYTRAMLHQRGDCWMPDWTTGRGRSCS